MSAIKFYAIVAIAGFVSVACQSSPEGEATNVPGEIVTQVAEETRRIDFEELAEVFAGDEVFLLDVRRPSELEEFGTVAGYTNIPIDELADRLNELPRDRPILTA
ncbi:MAG: hypothetical protein QF680_00845 [Acidobacteriota bacterium]|jgi:hypothetical protein|nr:hypothetical protein [Acidobacteriota bacterium]